MSTKLKLFSLFMLFLFILSACTGPAEETPVAETAPESVEQAETQEAILRVGWSSEPDTMNPLTTYSTEATEVLNLIYDKLISYDRDFKAQPGLAEEFSYSEDGLSIIFTLRDNAKWQDGEPVTVDDVVFTFNLIKENELGSFAQYLLNLTEVTTSDEKTVVLSFDQPQAFNPALATPILPKHIWEEMSAEDIELFANAQPIGSGPYKFIDWQEGSLLSLERNDDFWGDLPAADKIIFVLYGNEDVMAQALKGGDIDIITEIPPTIWDGLQNVDNVKAVSLPSYSFHHIGFNVSEDANSLGNPLLLDKTVRQALNYAIDRNQLVQVALAGHGRPGVSILPIGLVDWYLDIPEDEQMDADPEKAQEMLEAAGYVDTDGDGVREDANGNPLEFRLIVIESTSVDVRAAQLFRDAAEVVGIKLDLLTMDENTLGNLVYNIDAPDWDIFVWGWDSGIDPNEMLGVPLCSQIGGNNDNFYCNEAYDALYDQQSTTIDFSARKEIVDEMQRIFYEDASYIVMWYQNKLQGYRTDTWQGWKEIAGGLVYNITRDNYLMVEPVK
ncbi:MAG: ABC transporter substrate-binding protein [Anaerolineaceae bacterium]|nr:ABC transporter substrate-binding protein [Anaerolineaceae bacterium]